MASAEASVIGYPRHTTVENAVPIAALAATPDDPSLRALPWLEGEDELDAFLSTVVRAVAGTAPFVLIAYAHDPARSLMVLGDPSTVESGELGEFLEALNIEDEQILDRIDYEPPEPAGLPGRHENGGHGRAQRQDRPERRQRDGRRATSFVTTTVKNVDTRLEELRSEVAKLEAAREALVGGRRPKTTRRSRSSGTGATSAAGRGRNRASRSGRRRRDATRADQVFELVRKQPGITIPELAAAMEIQSNYLYRVLPKLAREGSVTREGRGWRPSSTARSQR